METIYQMKTAKGNQYGIWWEPQRENYEGGWVFDDSDSVALFASERAAKKDIRGFVHPEQYEPRPYARTRRSRTRSG